MSSDIKDISGLDLAALLILAIPINTVKTVYARVKTGKYVNVKE